MTNPVSYRIVAVLLAAIYLCLLGRSAVAETPRLLGVVLSPTGMASEVVSPTEAFVDVRQTPWIDSGRLADRLAELRGRPISPQLADRIADLVTTYHIEVLDEPFVSVTVPPQDVTAGVVRIDVQRGTAGRLIVEGTEWFSEDSYRRYFDIRPGQPIKMRSLKSGADAVGHGGFRTASPEVKVGEDLGETDIIVRARDSFPVSVHGGYDNTGTALTSYYRYNAGTTWGNAWGIGHELSYDFSADPGYEFSKSHRFGYYAPFASGDGLSLSAIYAKSKSKLPEPFDQSGTSKMLNGRYIMPLPDWKSTSVTQSLSGGLDFKRADNQLEFNRLSVNETTTDVVQFAAEYTASRPDTWGGTAMRLSLFLSPGGLTAFNNDERFRSARQGLEARYHYVNGDITRSFDLPQGFGLNHRLAYQFSPYRLLGSEQLNLAGFSAVRGYPESDATADYGFVLRNEFLFPAFSLGPLLKLQLPQDSMRFHVFYDVGTGRQQAPVAGEQEKVWLRSIGGGFNYNIGRYAMARFEVGHGLTQNRQTQSSGTEIHFGISLSY